MQPRRTILIAAFALAALITPGCGGSGDGAGASADENGGDENNDDSDGSITGDTAEVSAPATTTVAPYGQPDLDDHTAPNPHIGVWYAFDDSNDLDEPYQVRYRLESVVVVDDPDTQISRACQLSQLPDPGTVFAVIAIEVVNPNSRPIGTATGAELVMYNADDRLEAISPMTVGTSLAWVDSDCWPVQYADTDINSGRTVLGDTGRYLMSFHPDVGDVIVGVEGNDHKVPVLRPTQGGSLAAVIHPYVNDLGWLGAAGGRRNAETTDDSTDDPSDGRGEDAGSEPAVTAPPATTAVAPTTAAVAIATTTPADSADGEIGAQIIECFGEYWYNDALPLYPCQEGFSITLFQQALDASDYPVNDDGLFGPGTQQATINFQADWGLPVTGIVDADTWNAAGIGLPGSDLNGDGAVDGNEYVLD